MKAKAAMAIATAAALAGCISDGGRGNGPTKLPSDAYGAIWSGKPTAEVSACLARNNVPARYEARPLAKRDAIYRTLIVVKEQSPENQEDLRVYECA